MIRPGVRAGLISKDKGAECAEEYCVKAMSMSYTLEE